MTGTKMLRGLARAMEYLSVQLLDVTGQIERELARQGEPDSTDNGAHLLYVTDEDREAMEWVRKQGGIGCVQTMVATLKDTLNWIRERVGIGEDEVVDYDELFDALNRRLMPEGYEWPRYESGDLVMFGDCVENRNGTCTVNSVRFYSGGGVSVYGEGRGAQFVVVTEPVMHDPIRKANPKVIAADGESLEVGQTVWDTDAESDTPLTVVEVSSDLIRCEYTWKNGKTYRPCYPPDQLTHTKPEIDTWQRIEEDALNFVEDNAGMPHDQDQMERDMLAILRRCRALAERERGD